MITNAPEDTEDEVVKIRGKDVDNVLAAEDGLIDTVLVDVDPSLELLAVVDTAGETDCFLF